MMGLAIPDQANQSEFCSHRWRVICIVASCGWMIWVMLGVPATGESPLASIGYSTVSVSGPLKTYQLATFTVSWTVRSLRHE